MYPVPRRPASLPPGHVHLYYHHAFPSCAPVRADVSRLTASALLERDGPA